MKLNFCYISYTFILQLEFVLVSFEKGSLQGYDWMDISSDTLPYSELIYDIKKNLWKKVEIVVLCYAYRFTVTFS